MRRTILATSALGFAIALAGCDSSSEKKPEDRPTPISEHHAQNDPPPQVAKDEPPYSKPRSKVPPSETPLDMKGESFFHDEAPH